MSINFVKKIAVPLLAVGTFLLTGCAGTSAPENTEPAKSSDWTKAYNTAKIQWSNSGFRSMSSNQTPSEICGWIMTYGVNEGFNAYDGQITQREQDFYDGCKQYFNDIGIY